MLIHPIKGYYLEKMIAYTRFFQIVTTLYLFAKTMINNESSISYNDKFMGQNWIWYFVFIPIQCAISLYLLSIQGKNPKRWLAWLLLLVVLSASTVQIYNSRYFSERVIYLDIPTIFLVFSCLGLIGTTYNYLKTIRKRISCDH